MAVLHFPHLTWEEGRHLDPTKAVAILPLGAIEAAVGQQRRDNGARIVFPDVTKRPWALRLTEEFRSGACHAGQYESSIVMAARPELVREAIRRSLPANPRSLSTAIRSGQTSFEEAGGPRAYFGSPADAGADEGARTIEVLGAILEEAALAELARGRSPDGVPSSRAPAGASGWRGHGRWPAPARPAWPWPAPVTR